MNSDTILKVDNVGKQYRLGLVGTGTLSHDLNRWWSKLRGKEDPFLQVGETNIRSEKGDSDFVWALKDISFEVKRGEVLGIIGKNGAGKSTLLKILSRVTSPTVGEIKSKGRIASLLEVGTGFHPEMTGRENIYLNGAILGMTKSEIRSKIDEIIDFSGCLRYIDTPVKRYSSGMRVRLAFAVAAFLEPDILVVDEVLAVGDAEFQKKAIGKMQDISSQSGRTVLFVSHNMAAIENLCSRCILLNNGRVYYEGDTIKCITKYLEFEKTVGNKLEFHDNSNLKAFISSFEVVNSSFEKPIFNSGIPIEFRINIKTNEVVKRPIFSLRVSDFNNTNIIGWRNTHYVNDVLPETIEKNSNLVISIKTKNLYLLDGIYYISLSFLDGNEVIELKKSFFSFEIIGDKPNEKLNKITKQNTSGCAVFYEAEWSFFLDKMEVS